MPLSPSLSRPAAMLANLAFGATALFFVAPANAESWTDLRGTQTIEARMVGMWGDSVVLELQSGKRVTVNLSALRSESRIQAQTLQRKLNESRGARIKELEGQAVEANASAPTPLPMPPQAPAYVAPKAGQPVGDFLNQIENAIQSGHVRVMYDSLPPSYRADVDGVFKLAAEKVDGADWQTVVSGLQQLGDLIVTRQRWLLSSPRVKNLPTDQYDTVSEEVITLAGLLRSGLSPELTDLTKLRSMPLDQWLSEFDQATANHIAQLFTQTGARSSRQITVESETDDTAIVSIGEAIVKSKVTFQKVDGYWVPKTLADKWTEDVEAMKTSITEGSLTTSLSQLATVTGPLTSITSPMMAATTADQFHGAIEPVFTTIETAAVALGGMMGTKFSLAGTPAQYNGGYDPNYDSSGDPNNAENPYGADYTARMEAEQAAQQQAQIEAAAAGQGPR